MKTLALVSLSGLFLLGAQGEQTPLQKEQATLRGSWKIVRLENARGVDETFLGGNLEFLKDDKGIELTKDGNKKKGSFTLNPADKIKEITITPDDSDKQIEGIYQIEKNMLKICIAENSAQDGRPREFAVMAGKSFVLITLERVK